MKIFKYILEKEREQIIRMPLKSKIMDIQIQHDKPMMWALVDPSTEDIEVKINMYGTGWELQDEVLNHEYLASVQDGIYVWHFFMCSEI